MKDNGKTIWIGVSAAVAALAAGAAAFFLRDKLAAGADQLLTLVSPRRRALKEDRELFADM